MFIIPTLRNLKQMSIRILFATVFIFSINTIAAEKEMPHVFESGDASKGSNMVASCAACHGADGNSISSDWPKLAGQSERYLFEQLKYFKNGERENALMSSVLPILNSYSDKDLLNIAAYYSSQTKTNGQAKDDEELLALGEALYRSGNMKKAIPACTACHSVNGGGNALAGFPSVAGQQKAYLVLTLKAYRTKERNAGDYAAVMQAISQNLSDDEIDALANYMHGLYE
jgi:cytochrome c553